MTRFPFFHALSCSLLALASRILAVAVLFLLLPAGVGELDVIKHDDRRRTPLAGILVRPALLVVVAAQGNERALFERHFLDALAEVAEGLDLQVDPAVVVLRPAVVFANANLENRELAAVLAVEKADRRRAVVPSGHNGI